MKDNKLETIKNLFEGNEIRSVWNSDEEEYFFSVVDVINALTNSPNPRNYWNMLKKRMTEEEESELYTKCVQLKMLAQDGKMRETDTLDTEGIFRLIESVLSPKAEPFNAKWHDYLYDKIITRNDISLPISVFMKSHEISNRWLEI